MIFEKYVRFNPEACIVTNLFLSVLSIFTTTTIEQTLVYLLNIKYKNHMYIYILLPG